MAGYGEEKLSTVILHGTLLCGDHTPQPVPGASVAVFCGTSGPSKDYVPEDIESISCFEPPQPPDCSYIKLQLGVEDYAKEPPLVLHHLQMTLLNVPSTHMEIPPPLSRPQHVVLNHPYMQKGKSTPYVVALGSTN
ncbi:hypothetical protein K7X08_021799 [Anisodus acutangulus]|uniref:Association with the SNF1 complex (ASC) domain-containing protein n=1 Tax=Anisodus acutangulus TaxID=402998 RepID=A0A9Q1RDP8_9SOLA|nr:hypothetical protein K7X08_021799 [Anisodus acutangulus]